MEVQHADGRRDIVSGCGENFTLLPQRSTFQGPWDGREAIVSGALDLTHNSFSDVQQGTI